MATSNLQDLKTKRNEAGLAFNKLNEDPEFQRIRVATQTAFNDYKAKSAEADRLFKEGAPREQQEAARAAASQALDSWKPYNEQYQPLFKQATALRNEYNLLDKQVSELATTETSPPENVAETQKKEQEAVAAVAKNESSPQPPKEEPNLPGPEPVPSATNSEVTSSTGVVGYRTTNEEYRTIFNEARKKYGLDEVSENDPRLLEYISERRADPNSAGYTPPTSQPESTESYTKTADEDITDDIPVTEPEATTGYRDEFDEERGSSFGSEEPDSDDTSYYSKPEVERDVYNDEGVLQVNISGVGSRGDEGEFEEFQDEGFSFSDQRTIPNIPAREQFTAKPAPDWRFRISLAPSASYLYKDSSPGILAPLARTGGVIYPYTPQVTVVYAANYNSTDITHSNYKIQSYRSSSVESVTVTGDFTAQDSTEANYLLAVIHFFKSVTKMFYGQDNNPARGVPPPLCYLTGFGQYQFDHHPVVINNFTYTMPVDVDYVNAYPTNPSTSIGGVDLSPYNILGGNKLSPLDRLRRLAGKIDVGGTLPAPKFNSSQNINEVTRVPSKISLTIQCLPVVTRNTISNQFSLKSYATGALMRGSSNPKTGGGVW